MNSKEALERLEDNGRDYLLPVKVFKIIKQDLEQLEIANKNNEGLSRENVELINRIFELGKDYNAKDLECIDLLKENQELKAKIKYYVGDNKQ